MATLLFAKSTKAFDMKAKNQYATYSILCSDLPDDEDPVKIHIDTGSAVEWLDFLQSFKSLSRMKGWQQGSGFGPTIFRNLETFESCYKEQPFQDLKLMPHTFGLRLLHMPLPVMRSFLCCLLTRR
jgi:hypothetical protein